MKSHSLPDYGDAPLGMECAFPGEEPRLARPAVVRANLWQRMLYRFKYGLKISPNGRPYKIA